MLNIMVLFFVVCQVVAAADSEQVLIQDQLVPNYGSIQGPLRVSDRDHEALQAAFKSDAAGNSAHVLIQDQPMPSDGSVQGPLDTSDEDRKAALEEAFRVALCTGVSLGAFAGTVVGGVVGGTLGASISWCLKGTSVAAVGGAKAGALSSGAAGCVTGAAEALMIVADEAGKFFGTGCCRR